MAAEPIHVLSREIDPRGVVQLLQTLVADLQVIGPVEFWQGNIFTGPRGWLRKSSRFTILWLNAFLLTFCVPAPAAEKPSPPPTAGLQIGQEIFGVMPDGTAVERYTLTNSHGLRMKLTPRGAAITSVEVPDRAGRLANVTLGPDDFPRYLAGNDPVGVLIGRYANRIAKGRFTIDGVDYTLACNNGANHIHGGKVGFDRVLWKARPIRGPGWVGVSLAYLSRDGEEGYPGNLSVTVKYILSETDEVRMEYEASTDKPTHVNLTNHTYWNLAGHAAGNVLGHEVTIHADRYLPVDSGLIPLGELKPVQGTSLDFTRPMAIGARVGPLHGIWDHCYVLRKEPGEGLGLAARVVEPTSGRVMEIYTTQPAIQFYTGNPRALCLETEHYPDSPNQPTYPSTLLRPGQKYAQVTVHKFSVLAPPPISHKDVEYARVGEVGLKLDASIPAGTGPFPAVIIVHGGGFTGGNKRQYVTPIFDPLNQAGFAWFSIDYRLSPRFPFPAAIEDVDRAIEYVKAHAPEYKVDPKRIALLGESAGGHLVSYVGTQSDRRWSVAAVVSFYGPHSLMAEYDLRKRQGKVPTALQAFLAIKTFDPAAFQRLEAASPINHVREKMPPYLLVHGSDDQVVEYQQSVKMCERLRQAGNTCELYTVQGGDHGMMSWEKTPAYKQKVVDWLTHVLHK